MTIEDKIEKVAEEAEDLVELAEDLGLISEAEKYAKLLGYNFQSSQWYEKSYALFDKNYTQKQKKTKENRKNIAQNLAILNLFKFLLGAL